MSSYFKQDYIRRGIEHYDCIEMKEFVTAAGSPANVKYNLDKLLANPFTRGLFATWIAEIGNEFGANRVFAVPSGPIELGIDTARRLDDYKDDEKEGDERFISFTKEELMTLNPEAQRRVREEADGNKVLGVEDNRSRGKSALRAARFVGIENVVGIVCVVDRGKDVEGIVTEEQAQEYEAKHLHEPPVHFDIGVPYLSLAHLPLALNVEHQAIAS